jgi:hypothetical protein
MAAVVAVPFFMRDVLLTLKVGAGTAAEYQCHVSVASVKVTAGDVVTVQTLCSDGTFSSVGKSTYALVLEGVQDWSATGLSEFLWENEGAEADFVLNPYGETISTPTADTPAMTGVVTLMAGDFGGTINEYAQYAVELPCVSRPTLKVAA